MNLMRSLFRRLFTRSRLVALSKQNSDKIRRESYHFCIRDCRNDTCRWIDGSMDRREGTYRDIGESLSSARWRQEVAIDRGENEMLGH